MEFITTDQRIAVENFSIGRIYTITFKDSTSITRACIGKGADYVMFQETAPKMLFTLNMQTAATVDTIEPGTGTGTYDYDDLENKPQINSVTLSGNLSSADLGLQDAISAEDPLPASYISGLATVATTGSYSDLTGLPTLGTAAAADTTDFATAAQGSKADAADTAISTAATGFASLDARLDSMDTTISGKQGALSSTQLDAVNSGIDSTKVQQIATNTTAISGKQDTLTTAQLAAANSGITSAGVAQIETNKTNISSLKTYSSYNIFITGSAEITDADSSVVCKINPLLKHVIIDFNIKFATAYNTSSSGIAIASYNLHGVTTLYPDIVPTAGVNILRGTKDYLVQITKNSINDVFALSCISGEVPSGTTINARMEYTFV